MAEAPLPHATQPEKIRSMFDRIAPTYDLLNHSLSLGVDLRWRAAAARALALKPGDAAADLCAGTLDMSVALARAGARVTAVDFSLPMLRGGAAKAARHGIVRVQGDAMRTPLKDGYADAAAVAFGIRNVTSTAGCLGEFRRILKPGGRLAVLEFAPPRGLAGRLFNFYFRRILPVIGGFVSGDRAAYAYLPESVANYLEPDAFLAVLKQAGFSEPRAKIFFPGATVLYTATRA